MNDVRVGQVWRDNDPSQQWENERHIIIIEMETEHYARCLCPQTKKRVYIAVHKLNPPWGTAGYTLVTDRAEELRIKKMAVVVEIERVAREISLRLKLENYMGSSQRECPKCHADNSFRPGQPVRRSGGGWTWAYWQQCRECGCQWDGVVNKEDGVLPATVVARAAQPASRNTRRPTISPS